MGFLMPIGILVIRMTNRHEQCGRRLKIILYTHATLQILSFLLVTVATIMSIGNFDNSFTNNHQKIGLAIYGAIWLQAATGGFKPDSCILTPYLWSTMGVCSSSTQDEPSHEALTWKMSSLEIKTGLYMICGVCTMKSSSKTKGLSCARAPLIQFTLYVHL
ncbi:putative phytochrome C-like [Capsicum annuum]|nr:putative phytochrome C-like [Capsicum annuum]KAF3663101.1 putative phytochrome C-like [Capsicum annuum]